jgi:hypothetical protein
MLEALPPRFAHCHDWALVSSVVKVQSSSTVVFIVVEFTANSQILLSICEFAVSILFILY